MDAKKNFAKVRVIGTYSATATSITVDDASRLPAAPNDVTWWDEGNYPDPADDPLAEMDRYTAINGNVLTLASVASDRTAQQSTTASTKSTADTTYVMACGWTKKDTDDLNSSAIDVGDAYAWITEHGAVGDGTTDDKAAFDAAVAAGRTFIVVPSGTWKVSSTLTLGTGITLMCLPGCTLAPDTGITLTINGDILAGNYTIFGGTGTVTVGSRALLQYERWDGTATDEVVITDLEVTGTITGGQTVVESSALDVSTIGQKTCTIAHGLSGTPTAAQITLTVYRSSGSNDFEINGPYILSTDGTNINVYFEVTILALTTEAKVVARIFTD